MQQSARDFGSGFEDEGVGTGGVLLQQPVCSVIHFSVSRQFGEVTAYQGEVMFVVEFTDRFDPIDRVFIADMATDGIGTIGGIDDHPALTDNLHRLFD